MTQHRTQKKKSIQPLAYGVYFWTTVVLAVFGFADSIYLSVSHYRNYTDVGYESFCAISRAINCDTVSQSPYAIFFGIPVPVWGVVGYGFMLLLLFLAGSTAARPKRVWTLLFLLALAYSGYSIVLAAISHFYIHSYCVMCVLSYGINFWLLFHTWLVRRRFETDGFSTALRRDLGFLWQKRYSTTAVLTPYIVGVLMLWSFYPAYWNVQPEVVTTAVPTGLTDDGHPWIGTEDAPLVITEFADYMCFQCNKMHYYLRKMMTRYPGEIKIIHRHFPMDNTVNPLIKEPLHQGSGALSLMAIYAASEGRFWQMNDYLFANARNVERIDLRAAAAAAGVDEKKLAASLQNLRFHRQLHADIIEGLKLGVTGTPTFLIDGSLYSGQIPSEVLERVLK